MYLDYDEFLSMGGNATITDAQYVRLSMWADRIIDRMTHQRIAGESPVRKSVKYCAFDLIHAQYGDEMTAGQTGREVASVSNDGVSVTFADAQTLPGSVSMRHANIVRRWLDGEVTAQGVSLLYAGVI